MQVSLEAIFAAALNLSERERLELVYRLLEGMPAADSIRPDDSALLEELDRRFADDKGSVDWSTLRAEQ